MKAPLLLRIAAVITLVFAVGHTLGGIHSWSPGGETQVLKAMRTVHIDAEGASRTYLDFYRGFGFMLSTYMILQTVLLWQLASLVKVNADRARPMIAAISLASVAGAILSWKFIFALPVAFFSLIAVLLAASYFASRGLGAAYRLERHGDTSGTPNQSSYQS